MAEDEAKAEIREISYGSLVFRHIDRILSLSNKDFPDDKSKLFTFNWSVRLLRSSLPKDIVDKDFLDKEDKINIENKDNYGEKFLEIEKLYALCINLLADKGYLYRQVVDGEYEDS